MTVIRVILSLNACLVVRIVFRLCRLMGIGVKYRRNPWLLRIGMWCIGRFRRTLLGLSPCRTWASRLLMMWWRLFVFGSRDRTSRRLTLSRLSAMFLERTITSWTCRWLRLMMSVSMWWPRRARCWSLRRVSLKTHVDSLITLNCGIVWISLACREW